MLRIYQGTDEYHEKVQSVKEFINFHHLPKSLANRLQESFQHSWSYTNGIDMNTVSIVPLRIHHEFDGGIEKYVPRITDWHHEACRVMPNGDREGSIFLSEPHMNDGFFLLLINFHHLPKSLANRLQESFQHSWSYTNGIDMNIVSFVPL